MSNRIIKFRAWNKEEKKMIVWERLVDFYNPEGGTYIADILGGHDNDKILMQFTGLLDRAGKEIWESDIVKQGSHQDAEVIFKEGSFCTYIEDGMWLEMSQNSFEFKIIGNIYENPSLLNQKPE